MAKRQKRVQRSKQKRFAGGGGNVSPTAEPVLCDYCRHPYWRTDKRQRYCDPGRERKLAHLRRTALVDVLCDLLMWRLKLTRRIVQRMVDAAEAALLVLVRRLGWLWDETTKRFEWRAA